MAELKKRNAAVVAIDRVVQWVRENEAPTKEECVVQLEKLELQYDKFVTTHEEIVFAIPVDGVDEWEAQDALLIEVEKARDKTVARLRRLIGQLNQMNRNAIGLNIQLESGGMGGHKVDDDEIVFGSRCGCELNHRQLRNCAEFRNNSVEARRQFVESKDRCSRCLGRGHAMDACRSRGACRSCGGRHNLLLC